jgi:hypothetical protein
VDFAERVKIENENKDCQFKLRLLIKVQIECMTRNSGNCKVATGHELGFLQLFEELHVLSKDCPELPWFWGLIS